MPAAPHRGAVFPDPATVLDESPCGLVQTDDSGTILWANRTFCQWLGLDATALPGSRRLQDLLTMGGRIFHQTHWAPLLQMQGSVSEVKLELVHADGHGVPVIMNAVLRHRGGRVLQDVAVYVARDRDKYERELVLARRRLEATLSDAERLGEEAKDRALLAEQMVGIVSHDLRNPLSVIQMSAELLQRLGLSPEQAKIIDRMRRATGRANRLISDLLDFTRARLGGGIAVSPRATALQHVVHEAVDELKAAFPERAIRHEHEGGDAEIVADGDRLAQAIGNLVANAVAYGSARDAITVSSRVDRAGAIVSVHNFGPPISPQSLGKIFLPMERGDPAGGSGSGSGTSVGLGLYIVSEIARAHGGTVAVRSDDATGTEFTLILPREAPARAAPEAA